MLSYASANRHASAKIIRSPAGCRHRPTLRPRPATPHKNRLQIMAPACNLDQRRLAIGRGWSVEPFEPGISIGMQKAPAGAKQCLRMDAHAIRRVVIERRRWHHRAPGPLVANDNPEPSGFGLSQAGREHRDGGVSRPRESHPWPLAEPGVKLSPHPAPIRQVRRHCQAANVRRVFCSHARSSQGRGARVPDAGGSACIFASTRRLSSG